jgi:hypothetical protein
MCLSEIRWERAKWVHLFFQKAGKFLSNLETVIFSQGGFQGNSFRASRSILMASLLDRAYDPPRLVCSFLCIWLENSLWKTRVFPPLFRKSRNKDCHKSSRQIRIRIMKIFLHFPFQNLLPSVSPPPPISSEPCHMRVPPIVWQLDSLRQRTVPLARTCTTSENTEMPEYETGIGLLVPER